MGGLTGEVGKGHPSDRKVSKQRSGGRERLPSGNEELSGPMAETAPVSPGPPGCRQAPG